jgi:hypothetical protein
MTNKVSGKAAKTTKTKAPKAKAKTTAKASAKSVAKSGRGRPISTTRREGWSLSVAQIAEIAKRAGVSKTTALRYARSSNVSDATAHTLEMARKEAVK